MTRRLTPVLAATLMALAAAAPPAASRQAIRSFTLAAAGDVLIHQAIAVAARGHALVPGGYDFGPLLHPVEPWIADADLALCHLEGTLSPTNTGLLYQHEQEHPAYFNAPHEVAAALAATGYDACSTAGNHALDRGSTGVRETLEVLDAAGLGHSGSARSPEERLPALYRVRGVKVAHLAYTIGTNEPRPGDAPWAVNLIDDGTAILADARWAREHGAEFTIVSLHWGTEYRVAPDALQLRVAQALTASPDVDLILGHHVHAVQPITRVNDKVVAYGMGDHLSNIRTMPDGSRYGAEDGVIVHLTVTEQPGGGFAVTAAAVTPTWVDPATKRVLPVGQALASAAEPGLAPALEASRARTRARVGMLGEGVPLTPTPWPSLLCAGRAATVAGTAGPDFLIGTPGDDVIVGRGGSDLIAAGGGDDLVCAGEGDDAVWGGAGADLLYGGPGGDLVSGEAGADRLYGEAGDDLLGGGEEADALLGGDGDDALSGQGGADLLVAGPGANRLHGGTGTDLIVGYSAADTLLGDAGDACRVGGRPTACR